MKSKSLKRSFSSMTTPLLTALAIGLVTASVTLSLVVSRVAQAAPDRAPFPPEVWPQTPDSATRTGEETPGENAPEENTPREGAPGEDAVSKASWFDYLKSARLGLGYVAKEYCSCAFVMEREHAFCKAYAALDAIDATIWSDRQKKEVTTTYLFFLQRKAIWNAQNGCRLID